MTDWRFYIMDKRYAVLIDADNVSENTSSQYLTRYPTRALSLISVFTATGHALHLLHGSRHF